MPTLTPRKISVAAQRVAHHRDADHRGHEVSFHRAGAGGCCDCGDLAAWALAGCCPRHTGRAGNDVAGAGDPTDTLPAGFRRHAPLFARACV